MTLRCPYCGEICESDGEIPVGQHVECPFCANSFSYEGDAGEIGVRSEVTPEMKNAEIKSCGQCGTEIPPTASFCPRCGTPVAETPLETRQSGPEAGWIDLSDDKMASFYRWLKAIETIVTCGFLCRVFNELYASLSGMTIVACLIYLIAGFLLTCGISRGAQWARISIYALPAFGIMSVAVDVSKTGILDVAGIVAFGTAAVMLLLPNVSRKLKGLGRNSKPTWQVCLIFWGLVVIAEVLEANAPVAKGLGRYKIPSGAPVFALLLAPALNFCIERIMAVLNGVTGGRSPRLRLVVQNGETRHARSAGRSSTFRTPTTTTWWPARRVTMSSIPLDVQTWRHWRSISDFFHAFACLRLLRWW